MSSILGKTCLFGSSAGEPDSTNGISVGDLQRELAEIHQTEGLEEGQKTEGMEEPQTEGLGYAEEPQTEGMEQEEHTEGLAPGLVSSFGYQPPTGTLGYPPGGLYSTPASYSFAPVPTSGLGYVNPNRSPMFDTAVPVTRGLRQPLLAPSTAGEGGCECADCKSGKGHHKKGRGY